MVNISTNLLKSRRTLSEKDYQRERSYLRYSIIGLVVSIVVIVAMFMWSLLLTSRLSTIEQAIVTGSREIEGLVDANAQQVYLKSRLNLITDFLGSRSTTRESLQRVLSTNIPGTYVSGIAFEDEQTLMVQYSARDSSTLRELLAYYESDTEYFTQVTSKGLSRNKDGEYQLSVSLTLPAGGESDVAE